MRLKILIVIFLLFALPCYAGNYSVVGDAAISGNWYDVRLDSATGDGVTDDRANIATADGNAGTKRLVFPPLTGGAADYLIDSDLTISSGVLILEGARISAGAGDTVTFDGSFEAGNYQVFEGSGTFVLSAGSCDFVNPQWWGAVGDDSTDCHDAIEAAITAATNIGKVYIPPGIYQTTAPIDNFPVGYKQNQDKGYIIEGAGRSDTIIKYIGTSDYALKVYNGTTSEAEPMIRQSVYLTIKHMLVMAQSLTSAGGGILQMGYHCSIEDVFLDVDETYGTGLKVQRRTYIATEDSFTNNTNRDFTTTGGGGATESYAIAYTTEANLTGRVRDITVRLGKTGTPAGTLTAALFTDSSGPDAIVGAVSVAVTINNLSAAADGADQAFTFVWGDTTSLTASTKYWIVLDTTGYTYADGVTELRLRVEAAAGAANTFATFDDGGSSWSTSSDGSNNIVELARSMAVINYAKHVDIGRNTDGTYPFRGIDIAEDSQLFVENSNLYCHVPVYSVGSPFVRFSQSNIDNDTTTNYVVDFSGAATTDTGWDQCYFEGGSSSYPIHLGNVSRASFTGCVVGTYLDWTPGYGEVEYVGCLGPLMVADDFALPPSDYYKYRLFTPDTPDGKRGIEFTNNVTTAVDADALTGTAWDLPADADQFYIWYGDSGARQYFRLPTGMYLVTVYARASAPDGNDMLVDVWQSSLAGTQIGVKNGIPLTTSYVPYHVLARLPETDAFLVRIDSRNASNLYVSHVEVEYLGPYAQNQGDVALFNTTAGDADGDRVSSVWFTGYQSGDEQSYLAGITASHDGAADDKKGKLELSVNDGDDKFVLSKIGIKIISDGGVYMVNLKSGATQVAAGAAAGELWHDSDDDTIKLGT